MAFFFVSSYMHLTVRSRRQETTTHTHTRKHAHISSIPRISIFEIEQKSYIVWHLMVLIMRSGFWYYLYLQCKFYTDHISCLWPMVIMILAFLWIHNSFKFIALARKCIRNAKKKKRKLNPPRNNGWIWTKSMYVRSSGFKVDQKSIITL